MRPRRAVVAVAVAVLAGAAAAVPVALAGAGYWDGPALEDLDLGAAGGEVAGGRWLVEELVADGAAVPMDRDEPVVLELDTVTATLVGHAGCSLLLGSFTLRADGAASFTVPSARRQGCGAEVAAREQALRAVLEGAEAWRVEGPTLVVEGAEGRLVALRA